jgi:uncharacterized protein YqjF (DUF2071 family)
MNSILASFEHRPWPLPGGPWIMAQHWHDLLFAHWPVPASDLRSLIPSGLTIDICEGTAWLAVVPFRMSGVRVRATPPLPWLSKFPELNVRTYVVRDGKPGVWFFSLDAANFITVAIARRWFNLPYFCARMRAQETAGYIAYQSSRMHRQTPAANLEAHYRPRGAPFRALCGTLEYFLTERYCLYTANARGRLVRAEIHHPPWSLQLAAAEFAENTMAGAAGIRLPDTKPLLHFSKRQDVPVWSPTVID